MPWSDAFNDLDLDDSEASGNDIVDFVFTTNVGTEEGSNNDSESVVQSMPTAPRCAASHDTATITSTDRKPHDTTLPFQGLVCDLPAATRAEASGYVVAAEDALRRYEADEAREVAGAATGCDSDSDTITSANQIWLNVGNGDTGLPAKQPSYSDITKRRHLRPVTARTKTKPIQNEGGGKKTHLEIDFAKTLVVQGLGRHLPEAARHHIAKALWKNLESGNRLQSKIRLRYTVKEVASPMVLGGVLHHIHFDENDNAVDLALKKLSLAGANGGFSAEKWMSYERRVQRHVQHELESMTVKDTLKAIAQCNKRREVQLDKLQTTIMVGRLRLATWNVRGANNFQDAGVDEFLKSFEIDIWAVQELYGVNTKHIPKLFKAGYTEFISPYDRNVPASHGVAILIRKGLTAYAFGSKPCHTHICVVAESIQGPFLAVSFYMPTGHTAAIRKQAQDDLERDVADFRKQHPGSPVCLMMDGNQVAAKLDKWLDRKLTGVHRFKTPLDQHTHRQVTRAKVDPIRKRTIDFIAGCNIQPETTEIVDHEVSDHNPVVATVMLDFTITEAKQPRSQFKVDTRKLRKRKQLFSDDQHWKNMLAHLTIEEDTYPTTVADRVEINTVVDNDTMQDVVVRRLKEWEDVEHDAAFQKRVDQQFDDFNSTARLVAIKTKVTVKQSTSNGEHGMHMSTKLTRLARQSNKAYRKWRYMCDNARRKGYDKETLAKYYDLWQVASKLKIELKQKETNLRAGRRINQMANSAATGNYHAAWKDLNDDCERGKQAENLSTKPMLDANGVVQTNPTRLTSDWMDYQTTLLGTDKNEPVPNMSRSFTSWTEKLESSNMFGDIRPNLEGLDDHLPYAEILESIWSMSNNKAPGPSGIIAELFKACVPTRAEAAAIAKDQKGPLAPTTAMGSALDNMVRTIYETGYIPEGATTAFMVFLFKSKDPMLRANYRGLSLIDMVLKLVTSIATKRVQDALESAEFFIPSQGGFRSREECISQVIALFEICRLRKAEDLITWLIFLDLKKAYDRVSHTLSLLLLRRAGVHGKTMVFLHQLYDIIRMALKDGTAKAKLRRQLIGLRQGCGFSPCDFITFINSIFRMAEEEGLGVNLPTLDESDIANGVVDTVIGLLFADDVVALAANHGHAQRLMDCLDAFALATGMEWGITKCAVLVVDGCKTTNKETSDILLRGQVVERSSVYDELYLGIAFNDSLDKQKMLMARADKVFKGTFWKIRKLIANKMVPISLRRTVLNGLLIPALAYGGELFGLESFSKGGKFYRPVEKILDTAMAMMAKGNWDTTTELPMHVSAASLRLEYNVPAIEAVMAGKAVRGLIKYIDSNGQSVKLLVQWTHRAEHYQIEQVVWRHADDSNPEYMAGLQGLHPEHGSHPCSAMRPIL